MPFRLPSRRHAGAPLAVLAAAMGVHACDSVLSEPRPGRALVYGVVLTEEGQTAFGAQVVLLEYTDPALATAGAACGAPPADTTQLRRRSEGATGPDGRFRIALVQRRLGDLCAVLDVAPSAATTPGAAPARVPIGRVPVSVERADGTARDSVRADVRLPPRPARDR